MGSIIEEIESGDIVDADIWEIVDTFFEVCVNMFHLDQVYNHKKQIMMLERIIV